MNFKGNIMDANEGNDQGSPEKKIGAGKRPKYSWIESIVTAVGLTVLTVFWITDGDFIGSPNLVPLVIVSMIIGFTLHFAAHRWVVFLYDWQQRKLLFESVENKTESLQETIEDDFFNKLVKINFRYIDKYYLQTQLQADKAFQMSAVAAFLGFAVMAWGIWQLYDGNTQPGAVTTAAGLIVEFISAIFFYLYSKTIINMSGYHQKLVLTQNIGLALKISQDLPEAERTKSQVALIEKLMENINNHLAAKI